MHISITLSHAMWLNKKMLKRLPNMMICSHLPVCPGPIRSLSMPPVMLPTTIPAPAMTAMNGKRVVLMPEYSVSNGA